MNRDNEGSVAPVHLFDIYSLNLGDNTPKHSAKNERMSGDDVSARIFNKYLPSN